jgi:hypothetical protein
LKTTTPARNRPIDMNLKRPWQQSVSAILLIFALVILFYWKLVLTNQYTWLDFPDLAYQVLPWFQFQAGEWHQGRFPLWDPTGWFGQPLFGQAQPGSAYPFNWLLFLWPLKNGWVREAALNWYYVLIHFQAAVSMFALCRSLNRSRKASILAGCVYALGGYVGNTDWPQMINGAIWTPLAFLFLFKASRNERPWPSAILSGFFLGFGWLAGHHQMNLLATLAALGMWTWIFLREGRPHWKIARLAAVALATTFAASAFQTLPMAEYGRLALRWTNSPDDPLGFDQKVPYPTHERYELKPSYLLGLFLPGTSQGSRPYVGTTACALAFLGLALGWKRKEVLWLGSLAAAGLLYSLGGESLFHGLFYALVPLIEKARTPQAGTLVLALGLAPLCAFGVDLLTEASVWPRRVVWALAGLAMLITGTQVSQFLRRAPGTIEDRVLLAALFAGLATAVLTALRSGVVSHRLAWAALLALTLFEMSAETTYYLANADQKLNEYLAHLAKHGDLASFLRHEESAARVEYAAADIPYNFGDWYGIDTFNAYEASVLANVWNMDVFSPRAKEFFGVRYYLGRKPSSPGQTLLFTGKDGIKVFQNPSAFPRVWSVHQAKTFADLDSLRKAFILRETNPRDTALLLVNAPPPLESCPAPDAVDLPVRQPNFVHITANMACTGLVILTDSWFPGWTATVDGKPSPILEVDGGVRAVLVEQGSHNVDMKYRPGSVLLGALMTSLATVAAAVSAICYHRLK